PLACKALAISSPIACTSTVIHIEDCDAAACPELDTQFKHTAGSTCRTSMTLDQQRGQFSIWRGVVGVAWWIEQGMSRQTSLSWELDWLRNRAVRAVNGDLTRTPQYLHIACVQVKLHECCCFSRGASANEYAPWCRDSSP